MAHTYGNCMIPIEPAKLSLFGLGNHITMDTKFEVDGMHCIFPRKQKM